MSRSGGLPFRIAWTNWPRSSPCSRLESSALSVSLVFFNTGPGSKCSLLEVSFGSETAKDENLLVMVSVIGRCGHPRRLAYRDNGNACPWRAADGKAQSDRQKIAFGRSSWLGVCDLFRQNRRAPSPSLPSL